MEFHFSGRRLLIFVDKTQLEEILSEFETSFWERRTWIWTSFPSDPATPACRRPISAAIKPGMVTSNYSLPAKHRRGSWRQWQKKCFVWPDLRFSFLGGGGRLRQLLKSDLDSHGTEEVALFHRPVADGVFAAAPLQMEEVHVGRQVSCPGFRQHVVEGVTPACFLEKNDICFSVQAFQVESLT